MDRGRENLGQGLVQRIFFAAADPLEKGSSGFLPSVGGRLLLSLVVGVKNGSVPLVFQKTEDVSFPLWMLPRSLFGVDVESLDHLAVDVLGHWEVLKAYVE